MPCHLWSTACDGDYGADCVVHGDEIEECFKVNFCSKVEEVDSVATDELKIACGKTFVLVARLRKRLKRSDRKDNSICHTFRHFSEIAHNAPSDIGSRYNSGKFFTLRWRIVNRRTKYDESSKGT